MSTVRIIQISGTAVSVITDDLHGRLDGKDLSTYSPEAQAGFALFCKESADAFDALAGDNRAAEIAAELVRLKPDADERKALIDAAVDEAPAESPEKSTAV